MSLAGPSIAPTQALPLPQHTSPFGEYQSLSSLGPHSCVFTPIAAPLPSRLQFKPLRKYQYGPKGGKSYNPGGGAEGAGAKGYYEEVDNEGLHEALYDVLDWTDPAAADVELTADELYLGRPSATGEIVIRGLKAKQLSRDLVDFIFRRFDFCTRWQDPPPAEPEFMDLLRELQRQAPAHRTRTTPALTRSQPGRCRPCLRMHKSMLRNVRARKAARGNDAGGWSAGAGAHGRARSVPAEARRRHRGPDYVAGAFTAGLWQAGL